MAFNQNSFTESSNSTQRSEVDQLADNTVHSTWAEVASKAYLGESVRPIDGRPPFPKPIKDDPTRDSRQASLEGQTIDFEQASVRPIDGRPPFPKPIKDDPTRDSRQADVDLFPNESRKGSTDLESQYRPEFAAVKAFQSLSNAHSQSEVEFALQQINEQLHGALHGEGAARFIAQFNAMAGKGGHFVAALDESGNVVVRRGGST